MSGAPVPVLPVTDFFTPFNQLALSAADLDQGSGGVLLLPASGGKQLLVQAGKSGTIYLMDSSNLGQPEWHGTEQRRPGVGRGHRRRRL